MKEKVVIVGDIKIRKIDVYLLNNSINNILWSPVATANIIDMYIRLKPTLWDFFHGLFIIHVDTNDISLNKTRHVITEEILNLAKSVKQTTRIL